jgi:hypothetical protein
MSTTRSAAIAFLTELGAPATEPMIKAVSVWLRAEGPLTGQNGTNNPFNIETTSARAAQGKWYSFQSGWQQGTDSGSNVMFATFATPEDGARAAAQNLQRVKGVGYEAVVSAAKAGNPVGFLTTLGTSSWAGGHYAIGGVKGAKLLQAYGVPLPADVASTATGMIAGVAASTIVTRDNLPSLAAAFSATEVASGVKDPRGTAGWFTFLTDYIGKPVGGAAPYVNFTNTANTSLGAAGAGGTAGSPIPDIPGALSSLGNTATQIFTYLAALLVVALGIFLYSKGGTRAEEPVAF